MIFSVFVAPVYGAQPDYLSLWQELLTEQNGTGNEVFADKIKVVSSRIETYPNMDEFRVEFIQKIGWLEIRGQHIFTVKLSSSEGGYKHLPLPRDKWFGKDDIKLAIAKKLFNSTPLNLTAAKAPFFSSLEAAKEFIKKEAGIDNFIECEQVFYVPGKLPRIDGDPYLVFAGTRTKAVKPAPENGIIERKNPDEIRYYERAPDQPSFAQGSPVKAGSDKLIKGWLNLIDGKIEFWEDSRINY